MLKTLLLLLAFISSIYPQWKPVNTSLSLYDITALKTQNDSIFYVGTADGGIYKSTDAGSTWKIVYKNNNQIIQFFFVNNNVGFSIDSRHGFMKTIDGGESWSYKFQDFREDRFFDYNNWLSFNDDVNGILTVSGSAYKTTDGGNSFAPLTDSILKYSTSWRRISHVSKNKIFMSGGYSSILKTLDGGNTWDKIYFNYYDDKEIFPYVGFIDTLTGYAISQYNMCEKTTDGGLTWVRKKYSSNGQFSDAAFSNSTGFIVAKGVYDEVNKAYTPFESTEIKMTNMPLSNLWWWDLSRSTDSGETWHQHRNIPNQPRYAATVNDSTFLFAGVNGSLVISMDKGMTYKRLGDTLGFGVIGTIYYLNDKIGYVWADKINFTTDGGLTFKKKDYNTNVRLFTEPYVYDTNLIFMPTTSSIILKSIDNANTWKNISIDTLGNTQINYVKFNKDRIGFAATAKGLYKSTDVGESWFKVTNSACYRLEVIDNNVWITSYGKVYYSSNSGSSWNEQVNVYADYINFADKNNGLASGGYLYYTKDGGKTWEISFAPNSEVYSLVFFKHNDNLIGYAGLEDCSLLYTLDSGRTWMKEIYSLPHSINDFSFAENTLWASDETRGFVIKREFRGINNIPDEGNYSSMQYELKQNYPNPFNPSTTIKYSIPERGFVIIKVFDLLGREIRTLINEEKPSGSYEVMFNAEGLPSGVYFYSIHVGKFYETRKMLLVK